MYIDREREGGKRKGLERNGGGRGRETGKCSKLWVYYNMM